MAGHKIKEKRRKKLDWQGAIEEASAEASGILRREEIAKIKRDSVWAAMSLEEKVENLKRRIDAISNISNPISN